MSLFFVLPYWLHLGVSLSHPISHGHSSSTSTKLYHLMNIRKQKRWWQLVAPFFLLTLERTILTFVGLRKFITRALDPSQSPVLTWAKCGPSVTWFLFLRRDWDLLIMRTKVIITTLIHFSGTLRRMTNKWAPDRKWCSWSPTIHDGMVCSW